MLTMLYVAWVAYSFQATLLLAVGIALVVVGLACAHFLPGFLRWAIIGFGAVLLVAAGALQYGQAHGAHQAALLASKLAEKAEMTRADLAEKTRDAIASQAATDNAVLAQKNATLEKLLNDQPKTGPADRECLDRGLAKRLRNL